MKNSINCQTIASGLEEQRFRCFVVKPGILLQIRPALKADVDVLKSNKQNIKNDVRESLMFSAH